MVRSELVDGTPHYVVKDELNRIIGTIEAQRQHSDCAKFFAWKLDRYLGQAETVDYCLRYFH